MNNSKSLTNVPKLGNQYLPRLHGDGQGYMSAQAGRSIYQNTRRRWSSLELKVGAEADSLNLLQHQYPPEWRGAPRTKGTPWQQMLMMSEEVLENAKISVLVELGIARGPAMIKRPALWCDVLGKKSLKPQTCHHSFCCPSLGVVIPSKPVGADGCSVAMRNELDTQRKQGHGFYSLYFTGNKQLKV